MAWVTISDADTDRDSPITQSLIRALRDNPQGMANGDGGAPRLQAEAMAETSAMTDWALGRVALADAGAVGTYIMAVYDSVDPFVAVESGETRPGSELRPTDASGSLYAAEVGLAGTWRCMGGNHAETEPTLWLRVS